MLLETFLSIMLLAPIQTPKLELPKEVVVEKDDGFATVEAKCKGKVKWLVVGHSNVKYIENETSNSIIVGVPPNGSVTVFAIALVDGALTEFQSTKVVTKQVSPKPPVDEKPKNPPKPEPQLLNYKIRWK